MFDTIRETMDLNKYKDPVDWDTLNQNLIFLGHGPWRVIAMVICYLLIVFKLGPQFMRKKQPFDLRRLVRAYNFFNILFNIWLAYRGIYLSGKGFSFFNCHCLDRDYRRKKQSQITGLHVFHHSSVPLVIYLVASFSMTPFSGFLIVLNALVHVVMYGYYFLATFPSIVPYLWWKKYITRIQIGQFTLALLYFCLGYLLLPRFCDDPPMVAVVTNLLSALVFLVLFLSFYSGAYKHNKSSVTSLSSSSITSQCNSSNSSEQASRTIQAQLQNKLK